MKYLLTGSQGFIGSALSKRLLGQRNSVIPVTRETLYQPALLRELINKEKPDIFYHLASYGNHSSQKDVQKTLFANVVATFNVFEATKDTKCKVFNFSTSSVTLPIQTMYSITKFMGEHLSTLYPNVVDVRPYSVFGEGEADFRFIPTVCRCLILGEELQLDPAPVHDWIYIENFIDLLLANIKTKSKVLEIGTGIGTSNQEIVRILAKISGKACPIRQTGGLREYDNNSWMSKEMPKVNTSLDVGLMNTYRYYEKRFKN